MNINRPHVQLKEVRQTSYRYNDWSLGFTERNCTMEIEEPFHCIGIFNEKGQLVAWLNIHALINAQKEFEENNVPDEPEE